MLRRNIEFEAVIQQPAEVAPSNQRLEELHAALAMNANEHCAQSYSDLLGI